MFYANDDLFLTFYSQYIYAQEAPQQRYLLYEDGWNALLTQERFDWGFVLLTILSQPQFLVVNTNPICDSSDCNQKGDERRR